MAPDSSVLLPVSVPAPSRHVHFRTEAFFNSTTARARASRRPAPISEGDEEEGREPELQVLIARIPVAAGRGGEVRLEDLTNGLNDWVAALALTDVLVEAHRNSFRDGAHVLELGCGLGLPGMVTALMGAHTVITDLPLAIGPAKQNAAANGYPQDVWKVVGGSKTGGLKVTLGPHGDEGDEEERLATGSIVEELDRTSERLRYILLQGTGPTTGWVELKRPGGLALLERTAERPPATGGTLHAAPFDWADAKARDAFLKEDIDYLICSDCVFEPLYGDSWKDLLDCITALCGENTQVFITLQRRKDDGIDRFMDRFRKALQIDELPPRAYQDKRVHLYKARRFSRRELFHKGLDERTGNGPVTHALRLNSQPSTPLQSVRHSAPQHDESH